MKIALVQRPIQWEDPHANFEEIRGELKQLELESNTVLVFAEMFSTGFSFELDKIGEASVGPSAQFLRKVAEEFEVLTVGSFPHRPGPGQKGLNRLVCYFPDGSLAVQYDKIHPFSYGKEADFFTGGKELPVFEFQGWKICPTVCYDLRFPELYRRATLQGGAELFFCIANWPSPRRDHWNTLLRARAIENQAVMVAVNRVGSDPLNQYSGDSAVIDARGRDVLNLADKHCVSVVELEREELLKWRERFPALQDATEDFVVSPMSKDS